MKVLVLNAGSSSLKYQVIDMDNEQTLGKGLVEKIGTGLLVSSNKIAQTVLSLLSKSLQTTPKHSLSL